MFCSTTGTAFGPVFDSEGELNEFLEWTAENEGRDLRHVHNAGDLDAFIGDV